MRHIFIINPAAGKKDQTARIYDMADRLRQAHGLECQCLLTDRPGGATEMAHRLAQTGEALRVYACGGNLLAAKVSGINTTLIRISTFAIAGLLAGLSGFLMTSRVTIGQPTAAESYEMDAITACVVGGVSMSGGVGKPWGVVVGCLLITVIANGLDIMGVSSHWQRIVKGAIIVLAVLIDIKGKSKKN